MQQSIKATDIFGLIMFFIPALFKNREVELSENKIKTDKFNGEVYKIPLYVQTMIYTLWTVVSFFMVLLSSSISTLSSTALMAVSIVLLLTSFLELNLNFKSVALLLLSFILMIASYILSQNIMTTIIFSIGQVFTIWMLFFLVKDIYFKKYTKRFGVLGLKLFFEKVEGRTKLNDYLYISLIAVIIYFVELFIKNIGALA